MNNFTNKTFHEDNLSLMKRMPDSFIDLIYCDILYGTGRDFGNYKDIKADRNIVNNFYIPRFKEMYRLLKDTGSIYIHCDWRINHWIRCILDDIFGYDNFRNEIIWCYRWGSRHKKSWNKKHDNILFYSKSKKWIFNSNNIRENYAKNSGMSTDIKYNKSYNINGALPRDIIEIEIINSMSKERIGYNTQKPKALLERIIKASSNKDDMVADFFCGSGTTLAVAKELNRKYVGCDIEEKAVEITNQRLELSKPEPQMGLFE